MDPRYVDRGFLEVDELVSAAATVKGFCDNNCQLEKPPSSTHP
jgi:hypothetical protein